MPLFKSQSELVENSFMDSSASSATSAFTVICIPIVSITVII
ncbi:MAG TPA: hypothetical protein VEV62_10525 [Parafilimonas sp.]|nr:hypothetical protein [Parafilimonas sp.]